MNPNQRLPTTDATSAPTSGARREWALGCAVVLLAFALRVAHVLASRASVLFDAPQMDALYHLEWARALAAGESFQDGPFFRAPLYPWLLSGVLKLFGDGLLVPRLVQSGLGAAGVFFVWRGARAMSDPRAGLIAAALAATWWVWIFHDGELLLESLCTPLYAAALWATVRAERAPSVQRWSLAGVLWGLGAITRPNVLAFAPLLVARTAWRERSWKHALALALAWAAPIAPITAYNALVGGDAVLIASQGGVNLWIGNNPQSDGASAIVPGTREDWWGGYRDAIAQAKSARGRELRPSEVSSYYTERALDFITSSPGAAAALFARKLRLLWLDWEVGNNEEPRFLAYEASPWMRWLPVSWGGLLALALGGWIAMDREHRARAAPVALFAFAYGSTLVLFFVNSRFRVPMAPGVAMLAGAALPAAADAWRRGSRGRVLVATLVAAASFATSRALPPGIEARSQSNGEWILAAAELRAGRADRAAERLERALALDARNHVALRTLAHARIAQGREREALELFDRALAIRPGDPFSYDGQVDAWLALQRPDEALRVAREFTARAPSSAAAWLALGRAGFRASDAAAARAGFERALAIEPDSFDAAYSLAAVELFADRRAQALELFVRALEVRRSGRPEYVNEAFARAIELAQAAGNRPLARRLATEALAWPQRDSRVEQVAQRVLRSP